MAQFQKLEVKERKVTGSQKVNALRREGKVPAVFYFQGQDNVNLSIDRKVLWKALHSGHHIYEINLNGEQQFAMVKEVQFHPVTDEIIHVDLMRVRRSVKITIAVPLVLEGEAIGVKEGGVLMQNLTSIDVSCLPTDVPEHIALDISQLEMNSSLSTSDIVVGTELEIVTPGDATLLSIQVPRVYVEEVEAVEVEEVEELPSDVEEPESPPKEAPEETPEKS